MIVRHGQANTGATDEASYDRLSELGHQQAAWLGEHLRSTLQIDLIIHGAMRRQRQTAASLGLTGVPMEEDARLNELNYFDMARHMMNHHGLTEPYDEPSFAEFLPELLKVWQADDMPTGVERFSDFTARICAALEDASHRTGRVLLVSSTGVIATLAGLALDLDPWRNSKLFLAVSHTSITKFEVGPGQLFLSQFVATPHLDRTDREGMRTVV